MAAAVALVASLLVYYFTRESLPNVSDGWDRALIALVLIPATFGLVLLALPLWRARGLLLVGLALAVLALALEVGDFKVPANLTKLAAMTALGFAFLALFESVAWVVLVASLIPWVDSYSVWRGPTRTIVEEQRELFTTLSIAFPVPGERGSANLGLPDVLFFALFLAAAARFRLRVGWTWAALVASFGITLLAATTFDVAGLPALPLLSLGFLAPNADLLWRQIRSERARSRG
ncbi:MAG: hypothetical protein M3321_05690 [Actinomycetota bacterium]|nr:hypothetical protein [Actinomycetota bacterium]